MGAGPRFDGAAFDVAARQPRGGIDTERDPLRLGGGAAVDLAAPIGRPSFGVGLAGEGAAR